jgi:hypothetical protein
MYASKFAPAILLLLVFTPIGYSSIRPNIAPIPDPGLNISISNMQRFTSDISYDFDPAIIQRLDGAAVVFWENIPFSNGKISNPVINYRTSNYPSPTYSSLNWSASQTLVSTPLSQNVAPAVSQARNGTIYLSFASNRTGNFDIFLKRYSPSTGWYAEQQQTLNPADEVISSPLAASDGSLWLFWDRTLSATSANIFYKVWRSGSWGPETPFTSEGSTIENVQPSAFQMNDGSIWVVWSRMDTVSNLTHVYYEVYRNGSWSSALPLTSNANPDQHPHIVQDQNSTIWVAWNRELPVSLNVFQNDIFYTYSVNNGASFIPEVNLTNDTGCAVCPEDIQPSLAQWKDGRVYLFWASNRDPQNYWDLFYDTTNPQPFHHMAVTALSASPMTIRLSGAPSVTAVITVNVTVTNWGTFPESFWLFVKATNVSSRTIAAQYLSLGAGQVMSLSIIWNTNGVMPAKYRLSANIVAPANEQQIVTGDNTMTGGVLWLVPPGDITMDGRVDILDGAAVAYAFGSRPGGPFWNPQADLTGDGVVDILDASIVALWFGTVT